MAEVLDILHREFVYLWYYFDVQLRQIFGYWVLGILSVARMATQGLGFAGLAIFSGVVEMAARMIVSLVFVPVFGYDAICFTDQSAWVSASLYIAPVCAWCVRKITRRLAQPDATAVSEQA